MPTFDDAQLSKILAGRRAVARYPMPGADEVEVGIRALSESEIDEARLAALLYVEGKARKADLDPKLLIDMDPDFVDREMQRQVLFRACVDADSDPVDPRPFFTIDAQVRRIDSVALQTLWQHYLAHLEEVNPLLSLGDDGVEELVNALGKEQSAPVLWARLSPATQRRCALTMASQLGGSPPGKSSTLPSSSATPKETTSNASPQ